MDIEKYIDRLDQDRRDSEHRLREERQQMEARLTEERRLSEERHEKRIRELDERFKVQDQRFDKMEQKLESIHTSVVAESREVRRWSIGVFIATASMALATIIGIASIVASLL